MKTLILDSKYSEIPDRPKEKAKCICITFAEDDGVLRDIMLLDDETWQEQFNIYDKILTDLISEKKRDLFLINIEKNIGQFNTIQKWKGIWWEGKKGEKRFANQSKEIIINDNDCYIMAAHAQIRENEINNLLKKKNYKVLCFSNKETIQKLFYEKQGLLFQEINLFEYLLSPEKREIVFKKNDMVDYLLNSNAIILYFIDWGYEGSSLFMYGNSNNIEMLKQEINHIINELY